MGQSIGQEDRESWVLRQDLLFTSGGLQPVASQVSVSLLETWRVGQNHLPKPLQLECTGPLGPPWQLHSRGELSGPTGRASFQGPDVRARTNEVLSMAISTKELFAKKADIIWLFNGVTNTCFNKTRALSHLMKTIPIAEREMAHFHQQQFLLVSALATQAELNRLSSQFPILSDFRFPVCYPPVVLCTAWELLLILFVAIGIDFHTDAQVPLTHLPAAPSRHQGPGLGCDLWGNDGSRWPLPRIRKRKHLRFAW